jgi:L-ascorbate metabolism protein UlaG (beta-lactamase superfamily)
MGRPDVLCVPVGGSAKAYNAEEAKQAIAVLNPKIIIPTHYRTQAADPNACDIAPLDEFLTLMQGTSVRRSNSDTININSGNLPDSSLIQVLSYKF